MNKIKFFLLAIYLILIPFEANTANLSPHLKDAINYECKKLIKQKIYPDKRTCKNSLIVSLESQGIVSIKKVPNINDQVLIETYCITKIRTGALSYNKCIHQYVNEFLGLENIEPPVLVVNVLNEEEEDDPEVLPEIVPMPKNIQAVVYEKVVPSTFFVQTFIKDDNDEWMSGGTGTAVVIATDTLATNCHVIADEDNNFLLTSIIHVNDNVMDPDKWHQDVNLLISDFDSDRCIITTKESLNAPSVSTRNYKDLEMFEEVYAVGNPRSFVGKTAKGEITRLYDFIPPRLLNMFVNTKDVRLIETDVPIDRGNSGGGLYDTKGNLIGITSVCKTLGGPIDETGFKYCNSSSPLNWSIAIEAYLNLF